MKLDTQRGIYLTYPEVLRRFRQRYDHGEKIGIVENQLIEEIRSLQQVKTCLSIGTGYGGFDIPFFKRCLPNLQKLIVVEKDPNCCKELNFNLNEAFQNSIEFEVHEMKIEDFMVRNTNIKFDMILAMHVLYFLSSANRIQLLEICFDHWLKPNEGMLIFANPSKDNDFVKLFCKLNGNSESFQYSEIINDEITSLGLKITAEKPYIATMDLRKFDTDLFGMINAFCKGMFTEDLIKTAVEQLCPDGMGIDACHLCVVQKLD